MNSPGHASISQRLLEELRKYGLVTAYLYVCFGVLLLYEASLSSDPASVLNFGTALIKALVIGKFILIGEAVYVGKRGESHPLLRRIAWKSLAMLASLMVLKVLEELIVGWVHGTKPAEIAEEFFGRSLLQNVAPVLVMLLILIPLITATEIYRSIGKERFRKAMTSS